MNGDGPSLSQAEIATLVGRRLRTVEGWTTRHPDFPAPGQRTERAVRAWLADHPHIAGTPARPEPPGGPERRLTLSAYAVETGRGKGALYQYPRRAQAANWPARGERHWFPQPGDDGLYRLGDLVDWETHGRSAMGGPAARPRPTS